MRYIPAGPNHSDPPGGGFCFEWEHTYPFGLTILPASPKILVGIRHWLMDEKQQRIRVALIGAGATAHEHARAFVDVPGVRLAGIFSRTRAKAEQLSARFGIPEVCGSVSDLYARTRAELVVVAVSPVYTKNIALNCFEFPWYVLLEKPPGLNLTEAQILKEQALEKSRHVLVALNRRFYSSTQTALSDLNQRNGSRHIHVFDQQSIEFAASLGHEQAILDHWHYCCSIHLVDYLRVFGRGTASVTRNLHWDRNNRRVVVASITFDSGDTAVYECIWSGPGPWAVMVTTPEKRWEMRPLENVAYQDAGRRALVPMEIHPWDTQFKAGFRLQAEHAVAAALGQPSDSPTLEEAIESVRLLKNIYDDDQT
jgi:predicted dehydrogenase